MKKFSILIVCLLVLSLTACDEPEETDDEETNTDEIEAALGDDDDDDEEDEEEADFAALVEAGNQTCLEVICDRAHKCWDESEDREGSPAQSLEECHAMCAMINEITVDIEPTDEALDCLHADIAVGECIDALECDDLLAYVDHEVESGHLCADETAAAEEKCAFMNELFLEQMQ